VIGIRTTVDIDQRNPLKMVYCIAKGTILCRKFPYLIRKTKRGWHVGWHHLQISEMESLKLRLAIGDDPKRIFLDMTCQKKPKQILFSEKRVYVYERDFQGNIIEKIRVR